MGLSLSGLQSGIQSLVGQVVTALKFSSSQVNGSNAFEVQTAGARVAVGPSAGAWLSDAVGNIRVGTANGLWLDSGAHLFLDTAGTKALSWDGTNIVSNAGFSIAAGLVLASFTDDSANPGNRTVNTVRGKSAIASGASTAVITNSFVVATSQVICVLEFVDATATFIKASIPTGGSFTVTVNANATANTKFSWVVIN